MSRVSGDKTAFSRVVRQEASDDMNRIPPEVGRRIIDQLVGDGHVWHVVGIRSWPGWAVPGIHERSKDVNKTLVALTRTSRFWSELASPYLVGHLVMAAGADRFVDALLYRLRDEDERRAVHTLEMDLGTTYQSEYLGDIQFRLDRMFASFVRNLPALRVLSLVTEVGIDEPNFDSFPELSTAVAEHGPLSGLTAHLTGWPFVGVIIAAHQHHLRSLELRHYEFDASALALVAGCSNFDTLALFKCDLGESVAVWDAELRSPLPHLRIPSLRHLHICLEEYGRPELGLAFLGNHAQLHSFSLLSALAQRSLEHILTGLMSSPWAQLQRLFLGSDRYDYAGGDPLQLCHDMRATGLRTLIIREHPGGLDELVCSLANGVLRPPELQIARPWGYTRYNDEQRDALVRTCERVGTTLFWLDGGLDD